MAIEVISGQNEGHRINHPVYMDVYNVTYAKATITDFELVEVSDGWDLTDRCKTDMGGHDEEWLPIFYHCKLHCYNEEITTLRNNGALKGSAMAFQVGDEVKVLLEEGKPKYIIGHYDNKPRMCIDLFKLTFEDYASSNNFIYYQGSTQEKYGGLNSEPVDYYGDPPNCDQEGYNLFGKQIFKCYLTIFHYWGDFYVKVGPVFYIIRVQTIIFPGPFLVNCMTFKAVWTEELEQECIQLGESAEKTINPITSITCWPTWPVYPSEVKIINKLSEEIHSDTPYHTKWITAKLYGQSYDKAEE